MSALFYLVGLGLFISGLISIVNITDAGLNFLEQSQLHTLPFLGTYPSAWVYTGLGLICLIIAGGLSRRRK